MTDPIEYRDALPGDEDALVELWWGIQVSHRAYEPMLYADKGEKTCKASWREHFPRLLEDEKSVLVAASRAGNLVGMIVARFTERPPIFTIDRRAQIACAVVHPDFRGQGIFRGMLSFLEKKARHAGIRVMELTVHQSNPAREAYEKVGFVSATTEMVKWM